jgi:hypothetical protein
MPLRNPFDSKPKPKTVTDLPLDQRLFSSKPSAEEPKEPRGERQPSAEQPRRQEVPNPKLDQVKASSLWTEFALDDEALYQASYLFTQKELEALEDLKLELRREQEIRVSKQNLQRAALQIMIEDYRSAGKDSRLVRKLRKRYTK